ncbi:MAG: hypothetical protein CMP10_03505 [Zetaproteobacteria bacterium]|nr:hypothetical protein [Pseudobdellovibrionaceae bacterium]
MNKLLAILMLFSNCGFGQSNDGNFAVGSYRASKISLADGYKTELRVWYPTRQTKGKKTRYITRISPLLTGVDAIYSKAINKAKADCNQKRPVIIFSHGDEGLKDQSWTTMEYLASRGYIVAAIDHIGNTQFNNQVSMQLIPGFLQPIILGDYRFNLPRAYTYYRRPNDMKVAFDWLLENFEKKIKIDGDHCFNRKRPEYIAMGHSVGALTALMAGGASINLEDAEQFCQELGQIQLDQAKLLMCGNEKEYTGGDVYDLSNYIDSDLNENGVIESRLKEGFSYEKTKGFATFINDNTMQVKDNRVAAVVAIFPCCREMIVNGLSSLKVPTLVLGAEHDVVMPYIREAIGIADEIKDNDTPVELMILDKADHASFAEICDLITRSGCNDFTREGDKVTLKERNDFPDEIDLNTRFVFYSEWCEAFPFDEQCLEPDLVEVVIDNKIEKSLVVADETQQVQIQVMDFDLAKTEIQTEIFRFLSPIVNLTFPQGFPERSNNWDTIY